MRAPRRIAAIALATAAIFTCAPPGASAVTKYVDDDGFGAYGCDSDTPAYTSIQEAVDDAWYSDNVYVCPGVYSEQVHVSRGITVYGPRAGVWGTDPRRSDREKEAIVTGEGNGGRTPFLLENGAALDGLTVEGATGEGGSGAGIEMLPDSVLGEVRNTVVQDNASGLYLAAGIISYPTGPVLIEDNLFRDNNRPGDHSGTAIYSNEEIAGDTVLGARIFRNEFLNHSDAALRLDAAGPKQYGQYRGIYVMANRFARNGRAVTMRSGYTVFIGYNWMIDSAHGALSIGGASYNVLIDQNEITGGGGDAIRITDDFGGQSNQWVTATCNSISGHGGSGLFVAPGAHDGPIDAVNTYWGSASGPTTLKNPTGTGQVIDAPLGQVRFRPYNESPLDGDRAYGFQCWPTVSANAVEASEGDVGSKPYSFAVTLNKPVDQAVVVEYEAAGRPHARAGIDIADESGTLHFAPGETVEQIDVEVFGDQAKEPDETFDVSLDVIEGDRVGIASGGWGRGRIINDDFESPPAPVITATDPTSPSDNSHPNVIGAARAERGAEVRLFIDRTCGEIPDEVGTVDQFIGGGIPVFLLGDHTSQIRAQLVDQGENASGCSEPFTYIEDSEPPGVPTITGTDPESPADNPRPAVSGTTEPGAGGQVQLFATECAGAPLATGSVQDFRGDGISISVPSGQATQIRAQVTEYSRSSACSDPFEYVEVDPADKPEPLEPDPPQNGSAEPDRRPPRVTIRSAPTRKTTDRTPTFRFFSDEPGARLTCEVAELTRSPCSSPLRVRLARGRYRFKVTAADTAGNSASASRRFRIIGRHR